jgi:micrococcal nuclease
MDLTLDLGFGVTITITGRLYGINTPELRGSDRQRGIDARDWLRTAMGEAQTLLIETRPETAAQQGKYGRWLITVWADDQNLNDALIANGFAVPYSP